LGSVERFLGILIEHYAGAFPVWLSPVQVVILPVADRHIEFADALARELRSVGMRIDVDREAESVGKKIRNAEQSKVPVMIVVGDKEMESGNLTIRRRGMKDQTVMEKGEFISSLQKEVEQRK
jgi:threonyl-tRNA synthetase